MNSSYYIHLYNGCFLVLQKLKILSDDEQLTNPSIILKGWYWTEIMQDRDQRLDSMFETI